MGFQLVVDLAVMGCSGPLADREVWLWPVWRVLQWEFPWGITGLAGACLPQHASSPTCPSRASPSLQPFLVSGGPARPPIPGEVPALDPIVGAPTQASSSKTVLRPCLGKSTFLLAVYPRLWDFFPSTILTF